MKRLAAARDRTLGRCPRCMRKAFLTAGGAWALTGAAAAFLGDAWPTAALAAPALGLTALWLAHSVAFAWRAAAQRSARGAARKPDGALRHGALGVLSRRRLVADFAGALAVACVVAMVPRRAYANAQCGCRVGDVCCHPDTHVTYECQDVDGCTEWILTGHKCSSDTQSC